MGKAQSLLGITRVFGIILFFCFKNNDKESSEQRAERKKERKEKEGKKRQQIWRYNTKYVLFSLS